MTSTALFALHKARLLGLAFLALATIGCATQSSNLYYWGDYQPALYAHHQDGITQNAELAADIEALIDRAHATGSSVPPGVHAHLGMLYAEMGRNAKAHEQLLIEQRLFPESAHFINYVLTMHKANEQ
ncbi:DUF4810 domain-containing protein [Halopseudomonas salegens]|uniref:DUF4810 domain-containing protein n=1 Tax=Halopseudomonas salegens TaxID=1434072 RepID=A0A1H2FMU2_9GAMM|nr:DUF4810 domain-containing protein [Halopseudomonas salegens]SDU08671.1 hypothetical protein SAMN05216210_1677 [Halopseudomonas salegens]